MKLSTKDLAPRSFKSDPETGILTGYASTYWDVDSYGDAIAPGAFKRTVEAKGPAGAGRIPIKYEHGPSIGHHRKMSDTEKGLYIEGHISDDGQDGSRVRAHLRDGVPYGLSIGYVAVKSRKATKGDPLNFAFAPSGLRNAKPGDIRVIEEIKLYENSVVSIAANQAATVMSYRSAVADFGQVALAELIREAILDGSLDEDMLLAIIENLHSADSGSAPTEGETPPAETEPEREAGTIDQETVDDEEPEGEPSETQESSPDDSDSEEDDEEEDEKPKGRSRDYRTELDYVKARLRAQGVHLS